MYNYVDILKLLLILELAYY